MARAAVPAWHTRHGCYLRHTVPPAPLADAFVPFPPGAVDQSLVSRFEAQVDRGPDRLALASGHARLSYAELDRAANRLAHALLARRGPRHEPVALLTGQGGDAVVATLAVLKAGKFYVPLEPAEPPERLRAVLADARPGALVTNALHRSLAERLASDALAVIDLDDLHAFGDARPDLSIPPHRLAHVIYTSGSTGEPKGVLQNHRNALQYIRNHTNAYRIVPSDRVTLLSSCAFLGAMRDTFLPLLNGASVFPYDVRRAGVEGIPGWLARERITIYISVATVFRRFVGTLDGVRFPHLRILNLGGEALRPADVEAYRRLTDPACRFVNNLGTTETGTFALFAVDHSGVLPDGTVPAGHALDACEISLLDADARPVPDGGPGEIALTSRFLPLGYWRRAELTRAAYRPTAGRRGVRTYHTGDQGRRLDDGCLVVLGRGDQQVKIGGLRVELGEVEQALRQLPGVCDAVATTSAIGDREPRLIAYVVSASPARVTARELRDALAARLPGPAIPGRIVMLDALPLTTTGKVDRRALPAPGRERPELPAPFVPPRSPVETAVASVWRQVLGLDEIGVDDDFLDLDGQSLEVMQIAAQLAQRFAVPLSTRTVFECRTVAELARAVERALQSRE
jgi:amino acid adenylation domain-containing protein